jgi:hypothetical protein
MRIQTKLLEGRRHFVVPTVLALEGVLNGSKGPLLYPAEELRRSVPHWDGRPVVVYHPDMRFNCAAGNPEVFTAQRVGTLFNTRYEGKALKADAWLDEDRLITVNLRVLAAVKNGEVMEVSTGLHTENEAVAGTWQGREYTAIARNYRPDHLAILPDMKGACSVADGAGLCRNASEGEEFLLIPSSLDLRTTRCPSPVS